MTKKVHFIGIGGIGVSALARYYLAKGCQVSGSDLVSSEITDSLKKLGAEIFVTNSKFKIQNSKLQFKIKNSDLIIYSPAVSQSDSQLKLARKLSMKHLSYPEALGELTKKYFTIAVCGSHGKSTVAAMIGIILVKAGFDPTVIVGTKLKEFGDSNCRMGESQYLIIEADEHFASFLNYWPKIIVLTNLEPDHLDYYKNFKNYLSAFKKFISHLPEDGALVANRDDKRILRMLKSKIKNRASIYGSEGEEENEVLFAQQKSKIKFKIQKYSLRQKEAKNLRKILKIPGEFNVSNALAVLMVARALKIPDKVSFKALSEYRGSWRRFETKQLTINNKQLTIINDYGHHPTQIKVTLEAAREKFPKKKIWCIFQPHQYQRTYYLFDDFVKIFSRAPVDKLIITDIYDVAGRESQEIKKKVNSEKLIKVIKKGWAIYLPKNEILNYLRKNLRGREVVIIMGAGDIYNLSSKLKNQTN